MNKVTQRGKEYNIKVGDYITLRDEPFKNHRVNHLCGETLQVSSYGILSNIPHVKFRRSKVYFTTHNFIHKRCLKYYHIHGHFPITENYTTVDINSIILKLKEYNK